VSKRHPSVEKVSDLRGLSLEECDGLRRSELGWTIGSAVEGAVTSLMVTGAEVSATVSGGATVSVAVAAIAADVTTTMAVMGRSIGVVASTYGYDVRQPEEELFALGVLSLASANSLGGKAAAMASLSRLAQQMMRRPVWDQLRRHVLVNVIDRVYAALGSKLTIPKLAQAVPVAGAVINAGVNAGLIRQTFRRAEAVYRLRFLSEKYGIDPDEWRTDAPAGSDEADEAEGVVQVDQELEAEIEREQGR
jgi:hypothetical protein